MRRDGQSASSSSSSSCGVPFTATDVADDQAGGVGSQGAAGSSVEMEQAGVSTAELTHVIASAVDEGVLQGLPRQCAEYLEEVCVVSLVRAGGLLLTQIHSNSCY